MILFNKLSSAIGFPLFIICLVFSVIFFKRFMIFIMLSFLMIILRYQFHIQSSRYYSFFILTFLLFFGCVVKSMPNHRILMYSLLLFLFCFEVVKSFNQATNKYYYSLFELIEKLNATNTYSLLFSPQKDFYRFNSFTNILPHEDNNDAIDLLLKNYFYYGHPIFILSSGNEKKNLSLSDIFFSSGLKHKCIMKTQFSSKSNSYLSFYGFNTFSNSPFSLTDNSGSYNFFSGGDMEQHIDNASVKAIVSKWIDSGASFYLNDWVLFPVSRTLVNSWQTYQEDEYPDVYVDDKDPIIGNYSLHVKFRGQNQTPLYLFNQLQRDSYVISFKIKSLDSHSFLSLYRFEYLLDDVAVPSRKNFFLLTDSSVHTYTLFFHSSEFFGKSSLFIISGSNTEFLLDDVSCYQLNSNFFN